MKKKSPPLDPVHDALLALFEEDFARIYHHMEPAARRDLLSLAPMVFHKWYCSSLTEEMTLSPALLFGRELHPSPRGFAAYTLEVDFKKTLPRKNGPMPFSYRLQQYSDKKHPLLADLKRIVQYCDPDIETTEDGFFLPDDSAALQKIISHQEAFYLEYLTLLAWELGLVQAMPALYVKRMQPGPKVASFFALPVPEQLKAVIEEVLLLASERFADMLGMGENYLPPDFFRPYLMETVELEQIFIDLYQLADIDIESIWNQSSEESLSPEDASVLSSFFLIGVMLDKWFLTPLDAYLHVIQCLYITPYSFLGVINHLSALSIMGHDPTVELYAPCSYYAFTPLGISLLHPDRKQPPLPKKLDLYTIVSTLYQLRHAQQEEQPTSLAPVYTFKVKLASDKRFWRILDFHTDMPLSNLCQELSVVFGYEPVSDYTLSKLDSNGFPIVYAPQSSKRAINPAEKTLLMNLTLAKGDTLTFTPVQEPRNQLTLEFLEESPENPYIIYPRLRRQSTLMTQMDALEEPF